MNIIFFIGIVLAAVPFVHWAFFNKKNIDHESAAEDDQREIDSLEGDSHEEKNA